MREQDKPEFSVLVADVYKFYRAEVTTFALGVWWSAMRPFDLAAVREAFGRHVVNPDTGQFLPKPADVVKMLGGTTQDAALVAWAKVDRAIRVVGTYESVAFDDALIHRVIEDMGGWVKLGQVTEDELPFRAKEFETRYRGFRIRSESPEYPRVLIGIHQAHNEQNNRPVAPPVLIGNTQRAQLVMAQGTDAPRLNVASAAQLGAKLLVVEG